MDGNKAAERVFDVLTLIGSMENYIRNQNEKFKDDPAYTARITDLGLTESIKRAYVWMPKQ